jgi:hypothetical protein
VTAVIDNHRFYIASKTLEASVTKEAYERAKQYEGQILPSWKANLISKSIGKEAYEAFKNQITGQFQSESYSVLISLLLEARMTYFAHSLPEGIKVVILGEKKAE